MEILDKCRMMGPDDYLKLNETNPKWNLRLVDDEWISWIWVTDMFKRIKESDENNTKCVMLLPNPAALYKQVAYLINTFNVSCRNLVVFTMDEWANEDGVIAPPDYPAGFTNAFFRFFYGEIREDLRPPLENIHYPSNENIEYYSKMIEDEGECDIAYTGCGWSGHTAFVDAVPQYGVHDNEVPPLDEWLKMGARVQDLHILTLAQNSLHASFGMCGDVGFVPPRAASVGPRDIYNCKHLMEMHFFSVGSTDISWQRFISRLACFGPVTPLVPNSISQLVESDVLITHNIAKKIELDLDRQYR